MRPSISSCHQSRLSGPELEEYRRAIAVLQKINCIIGELLVVSYRYRSNLQECRRVSKQIISFTSWINLFIEQCERIVVQAIDEKPLLIRVVISTICGSCMQSGATHDARPAGEYKSLSPDPVLQAQVRSLLTCMDRFTSFVFKGEMLAPELRAFADSMRKLNRALLRQKRNLEQLGAVETEIVVEERTDKCARCGRMLEERRNTAALTPSTED